MRFMLDTMIFEHIAADDVFIERVRGAVKSGQIRLLTTQIQEDQLADAPDDKRRHASRIPREVVPTEGMVLDASHHGLARLGDDETNQALERIGFASDSERATLKNRKDALIATTARAADVLVTDDKKFRNRIRRQELSITVWSFANFRTYLDTLA